MARKATKLRATSERDPNFEPPPWAIAAVVASIAVIFIYSSLPDSWRESLPYGDSDFFYVGLIALPIIVMIGAAMANGLIKARRSSTWIAAPGRITRSETVARAHRFAGETSEIRNFPSIDYGFKVDGVAFKGTRISMGDDTAGANTEATLKRYPKGAEVTVYFDPANPKDCVLERDMPKDLTKGCLQLTAILVVVGAALYWGFSAGWNYLNGVAGQRVDGAAIFAGIFGAALLFAFFAVRRNAKAADSWLVVPGEIVVSEIERIESNSRSSVRKSYAPFVEYVYEVNGIEYHGKQIKVAFTSSGSQASAEQVAARYRLGAKVEVHYDPANPERAALENTGNAAYLLLAGAAFCFGVAAYAGGVFG